MSWVSFNKLPCNMRISENGHSNLGIMGRIANKNIIWGLGIIINNSVISLGTIVYLEIEETQWQYKLEKHS